MKEVRNAFMELGIQIAECTLGIVYAIVHGIDKLVHKGMVYLEEAYKNLNQDTTAKHKTTTA